MRGGFVYTDEFIEFNENAEYTLIETSINPVWLVDPYGGRDRWSRMVSRFDKAERAWEAYRLAEKKVGESIVCASLRRNGELIAMREETRESDCF